MFETWGRKNGINKNRDDTNPNPEKRNGFWRKRGRKNNYGLEFEKGEKNGGGEYGRTEDWDCTK